MISTKLNWVSFTERLPEEGDNELIVCRSVDGELVSWMADVSYENDGDGKLCFVDVNDDQPDFEPTHWAEMTFPHPLPSMPDAIRDLCKVELGQWPMRKLVYRFAEATVTIQLLHEMPFRDDED